MKKALFCLFLTVIMGLSRADYTIPRSDDDLTIKLGADVRARWETFDRAVTNPAIDTHTHPATQYLRVRTRAWMAIDIVKAYTINLRLANRIHHVSSSPSDPNNRERDTWEEPDEVYLDLANVVFHLDDDEQKFSITLGRQAVAFGNGLIFSDATPFDQGRSNYNDGVMLRYKTEFADVDDKDTTYIFDAALFSFYDEWKDDSVFINDRNRRLRSADIFTVGTYVTGGIKDTLTLDGYFMYNHLHDEHPTAAERNFAADVSGRLYTSGLRLFYKPDQLVDFSLEGAQQCSQLNDYSLSHAYMVDARMNVHLDEYLPMKPTVGFEYTHFSGDKAGSDRQEGWFPIFSQAPLWGDELIPIMLNGNWTNLNAWRAFVSVKPIDDVKLLCAATKYVADESHGYLQANSGDDFGDLLSTSAEYKLNDYVSFLCQVSYFMPGDYFANGHNSFWTRFQILCKF